MSRVAIVGLGQIGMSYDLLLSDHYCMSYCKAFLMHKHFSICAGVDVDQSKRDVFECNFNAPFYDSVEMAVIETKPSILAVCVNTDCHLSVIERALLVDNRIRYILCEKPFGVNASEAKKIIQLCKRSGVKVFVNYMRYSVYRMRDCLRQFVQDSCGYPIRGNVNYTGTLLHSGSHFLQLMLFIFQQSSIKFYALSDNIHILSDGNTDIRFIYNGINLDNPQFSHYEVDLLSGKSRLKFIRGGREIEMYSLADDEVFSNNQTFVKTYFLSGILDRFQYAVVSELYNAITGRPYHLCSGDMGLQIHKLCEGVK